MNFEELVGLTQFRRRNERDMRRNARKMSPFFLRPFLRYLIVC